MGIWLLGAVGVIHMVESQEQWGWLMSCRGHLPTFTVQHMHTHCFEELLLLLSHHGHLQDRPHCILPHNIQE